MAIDRGEFEAWLKAQGVAIAGRTRSGCDCPIANFLKSKKLAQPNVANFCFWDKSRPSDMPYPLPGWATQFIGEIDDSLRTSVTGAVALEVLGGISDAS